MSPRPFPRLFPQLSLSFFSLFWLTSLPLVDFPVNHWCMNPCLRLWFWRMTKCNGHMHNTTRSQNMERKMKLLVKELSLGMDKNIIYVWNWKLTDWRTNFGNNFILLAIGVWISIFDRHNLHWQDFVWQGCWADHSLPRLIVCLPGFSIVGCRREGHQC